MMDWKAMDHLLFIMALSCIFTFNDWKTVIILVTAFTIGHSLTLALAALDIVKANSRWVEFLITCTIVATAISNLFLRKYSFKGIGLRYYLALGFGLIHGLGFASTLSALLGKSTGIVVPLLGFNLGLEAGQLVAVLVVLTLGYLLQRLLKLNRREWVMLVSGGALFSAMLMVKQNWPF
jgi:hypothetical protein